MHIPFRTTVLAAIFTSLVTGSAMHASLVGMKQQSALAEKLYREIGRAGQSYKTRQQFAGRYERAEMTLKQLEERRAQMLKEQQALRDERDMLRTVWKDVQGRGLTASAVSQAKLLTRLQQAAVVDIARSLHRAELGNGPLVAAVHGGVRAHDMALMHKAATMADLTRGGSAIFASLLYTEERLAASRQELLALNEDMEIAKEEIAMSEEGLTSVRAITRDVHDQILLLQRALSRIDAQLRTRAERSLIAKGLLSASPDRPHASAPDFVWPVEGTVTAGFKNAEYLTHFGVPHLGTDIAVPQGSSVKSAADGIVFLVRDGGEKGYSYILIGHRDGYATLYGHLSAFSVSPGQRVSAGEEIARSGGTPGTYGAGPMTSGAHLHFEIIQDGANVNPLSVLSAR